MDEAFLLLVAFALLVVSVVLVAVVLTRLRRSDERGRALERRLTDLERAFREQTASTAPPPPTAPPPVTAATRAPPASRTVVPPAEDDYAAAEQELRAEDSGEWAAAAATGGEATAPAAAHRAPEDLPPPGDGPVAPPRAAGRVPEPAAAGARRPAAFSLEDFLGGRVLLVVGVIVVLFALGFFLKYAIDNELIAPPARVAIGVLSGVAALVGGDVLRRRGFDVFGHAVMGGGLGALFLSTFFATVRYDLIGRPVGFGLTAAVAVLGLVLALRREAPLLAYLGLLGGYVAPAILGGGGDALEGLTGWLLALHVGVLVVLFRRRWPGLDLLALTGSGVYYFLWADRYGYGERLDVGAWCLIALTALVLAIALAPALLRRRALMPTSLGTAIIAGAASVTAGFELFEGNHPYVLGCGILALAAVFAVAARRAHDCAGDVPEGRRVDAPALQGCAIAAVAAAVPTFLGGGAIAPAWAATGVVAVLVGATRRAPFTVVLGFLVIALAQIDLLDNRLPMHDGAFLPFANAAFFSWASPSIALVVAGLLLRFRSPWRIPSGLLLGAGAWLYAPVLAAEIIMHFLEGRATYGAAAETYAWAGSVAALAVYSGLLSVFVHRRRDVAILVPLGPLAAASLLAMPVVLFIERPGFVPLFNVPFAAGVVCVAAWWLATRAARRALRVVLLVGSVLAGLFVIGAECWAPVEHGSVVGTSQDDLERTALVWMSVSFSVYAAALLVTGFARRVPALRWSGLAIFLLTLAKVFFIDMAQLPTAHRIGGFLVLGLLLVGASFLYQRARKDAAPPEPHTPEPES